MFARVFAFIIGNSTIPPKILLKRVKIGNYYVEAWKLPRNYSVIYFVQLETTELQQNSSLIGRKHPGLVADWPETTEKTTEIYLNTEAYTP